MPTINRKETLAALETVKPALASRASIPELGHIWFDREFVYAHNGGLGIKTEFESPFECGVPGGLFLGLLNQAAAETLEFETTDDGLSFKSGRSRIKMNTLPLDRKIWRYPETPEGKPVATLKATKGLLAGLKNVMMLRPSSPQRMEHHAVCIFAVEKEMDLYVTDGKAMVVVPVPEPLTGAKKLAVPREFVEQLVAQCTPGQMLRVYADHFVIDANGKTKTTLYSNVFDTREMLDLPSYADKWIDTKAVPPFKLPDGLGVALERALLLAGGEEPWVKFTASAKALKLQGKFKLGQLDEDFVLSRSVPKASIFVDAKLLLSVKGVGEVSITDQVIVLFGEKEQDFTYVLSGRANPVPVARDAAPSRRSQPQEEDADA